MKKICLFPSSSEASKIIKKLPNLKIFRVTVCLPPPKVSLMDTRKSRKWIRLNRIVVGQVGDRSHPPISGKKLGDWGWGIPPTTRMFVSYLFPFCGVCALEFGCLSLFRDRMWP